MKYLYPCFVPCLTKICQRLLEKIFKFPALILLSLIIFRSEMEMILHLTNLKPCPQGSVVPTVVNICPVVLEENIVKHQIKLSTFPLKA